ncbi:MAG TPA: hypothetical protein PKM61_07710 [bacterium]|nr:hypothetical protein [bacterium]
MPESNPELKEQIRKIAGSEKLSEAEQDRLIGGLLGSSLPESGPESGLIHLAFVISFLVPFSGILIGSHYLIRYGDDGLKPGFICLGLTLVAFLIHFFLLRGLLAFLAGGSGPLPPLPAAG